MDKDKNMVEILESIKMDFRDVAVECVESFFQKKSEVKEPWRVVERLQGTFDHIFSLGSSNQEYQAIMAVGAQKEHMQAFIGYEIDECEMVDAFGEFTNNYCALLNDVEKFKDNFGILRAAIPTHSLDQSFFPKVWGVNGRIDMADHWMYLGYSIRRSVM
jgi:hypothetical protein